MDLTAATLKAEVRDSKEDDAEVLATFTVNIVDAVARQIRLTLTPTQTASLPRRGYWDLEVTHTVSGWKGSPLQGRVSVTSDVTRS